jgi:nitrogenase molybdenum-iron protein alpha/beta subunit
MRIRPDGFTGALMAVEGIDDARAILHGPGGCRMCHMILSRKVYPRMEKMGMAEYNLPYFYGQPRVPCTFLEEHDYISGAYEIIKDALPIVGSKNDKMIVVINSPGAALIGDNHEKAISETGLKGRAFSIEESLISVPLSTGYDVTMKSILEWLDTKSTGKIPNSVNLIGMSVMDKDWKNGVRELKKTVELMGLNVLAVPGAGCSVSDLQRSVNASWNIVVYPEYGLNIAEYYKKKYGIPYIISPEGAPVGFDAIETWIRTIAESTSANPKKAMERVAAYKKDVFDTFMGSRYKTIKMQGASFSVCGDASVVYPLTKWLYDYLSLMPVAVATDPGSYQPHNDSLKDFLESIGMGGSWGQEPVESDFVFADGDSAMIMESSGTCLKGIDIGMPTLDYDCLIPRPILGAKGAMYIIDEIMRSV